MAVQWDAGAPNCAAHTAAPIQVHAYNPTTIILRENLCATFEAPFMYLLIGANRAMLIDDGDVADANAMPIARTVMGLLPARLPLLVVHTHRHLDHRAGDVQFARLPNGRVVGYEIDSVKAFYHFTDWPNDVAQIDLGGRIIDAIPAPGHNETELVFYDRNTGLLFSGDFLLPGRLLIDDATAEEASARRVVAFAQDHPITYVLGGHIEVDSAGRTFTFGSQYHPHEHVLQLSKADLLALPDAVDHFNGFYTERGSFIMMDQIRVLIAEVIVALLVLGALVWLVVRWFRARRRVSSPS